MTGSTSINEKKFNIYTFKLTEKRVCYRPMDPPLCVNHAGDKFPQKGKLKIDADL
jgi:hypothetical protein